MLEWQRHTREKAQDGKWNHQYRNMQGYIFTSYWMKWRKNSRFKTPPNFSLYYHSFFIFSRSFSIHSPPHYLFMLFGANTRDIHFHFQHYYYYCCYYTTYDTIYIQFGSIKTYIHMYVDVEIFSLSVFLHHKDCKDNMEVELMYILFLGLLV